MWSSVEHMLGKVVLDKQGNTFGACHILLKDSEGREEAIPVPLFPCWRVGSSEFIHLSTIVVFWWEEMK